MLKKLLLVSSLVVISTAASAAGGYVGLSVGQTDPDRDGFDDGTSVAITGGFKVNDNFAVEASYIDLGDSSDDIDPIWTIEADGINFSAVGIIPINESVDLFAKAGLFMWDATIEEAGYGEFATDDGTDISLGFGAAANLAKNFGLVFEYQMFELDEDDASNISLGARFIF